MIDDEINKILVKLSDEIKNLKGDIGDILKANDSVHERCGRCCRIKNKRYICNHCGYRGEGK
jgi:hypothetical protein